MPLAGKLNALSQHLVDILEENQHLILTDDQKPAFKLAVYGEPKAITEWPLLTVEPQNKSREIGATQKFDLEFEIHLILYHGEVDSPHVVQKGVQERAERVETFIHGDYKWNFVDSADSTKDQVIFGWVASIDHPLVLAPQNQIWSASRLVLRALSQETFSDAQ